MQTGSTPSSWRFSSMKPTISDTGGRAPPGSTTPTPRAGSRSPASARGSPLELFDPCSVLARGARLLALVDVSLANLGAHRLDTEADLAGDSLDRCLLGAELGAQLADESHCLLFLRRAVSTRRRLTGNPRCWHGSIFVPKVWSLRRTQGGSSAGPGGDRDGAGRRSAPRRGNRGASSARAVRRHRCRRGRYRGARRR